MFHYNCKSKNTTVARVPRATYIHNEKKTIKFLVPYPYDIARGQRFGYEQYLEILKSNNFDLNPVLQ